MHPGRTEAESVRRVESIRSRRLLFGTRSPATSWRWRSAQRLSVAIKASLCGRLETHRDTFVPAGQRTWGIISRGRKETLWSEESLWLSVQPSGAPSASRRRTPEPGAADAGGPV